MIQSRFDWHGDTAKEFVIGMGWDGIQRVTEYFLNKIHEAVNIPNTGQRVKRKRGKGTYTIYPNPSKPGEAPHLRSGWFKKHIQREYDKAKLTSRVGLAAGARYGLFLEMGTRFMAARPWLLATLKKFWDQIKGQATA